MATIFERANPEDFDEIVDLANYVFSYDGVPHDFPKLLPKLYKREHGTAIHHFVARENGKIMAVVGVFPMRMIVSGEELHVYGIGTVCTHPYRRSLGYMKNLMNLANDAIVASGADFGCLGGQRQRYGYYGYDLCGQSVHFTLGRDNVRHSYDKNAFRSFSFRSMSADDADLEKCREWFERRPAHVVREPERFFDIQMSYNAAMWCILTDGIPCGYLVASNAGVQVQELVMADGRPTADLLSAWIVNRELDRVQISLPPYDQEGIASLSHICAQMSVRSAENFSVFRFPSVVKAFLQLKAGCSPLPDGSMVLSVEGRTPFRIWMAAGSVHVEETEAPANLSLTYMDALAFLFGPLGGVASTAYESRCIPGPAGWSGRERTLARAWFPLPLFFDGLDNV
jgi:predicted acetyltransferase